MHTYIVNLVFGSILNFFTIHLNGIWRLLWRYLSKPVLGGHPVLSGRYSISRGCPLNTGFTVLGWSVGLKKKLKNKSQEVSELEALVPQDNIKS